MNSFENGKFEDIALRYCTKCSELKTLPYKGMARFGLDHANDLQPSIKYQEALDACVDCDMSSPLIKIILQEKDG